MSNPKYMSFLSAPISTAHTYGNVTAFITEKIKSWFHPEYFKTVNISSTIASYNFRLLRNKKSNIFRKEKPYLIVVPRFVMDSEIFLNNTLMTNRYSEEVPAFSSGNLFTFVQDDDIGLNGKYIINRDKISFDVTLFVDTAIQQLNVAKMLRNRIMFDKPLNWYTNLECQIPREIMSAISYMKEIPLTEPANILEYVNSVSDSPVTYMLKSSSGNDEYFKYYQAQLDVLISNLSLSDGAKKNMVDDYFTINFTVDVEFFTLGEFFMYTTEKRYKLMQQEIREYIFDDLSVHNGILGDNAKGDLQIIFTPYEDVGIDIQPGWNIVAESSFKVEKKSPDVIPFASILHDRHKEMINWHLKNNITLDKLIDVFIIKDGKPLDKINGDFIVDFESMQILVYNIYYLSTYRLVIVMNNRYVNELALQTLNV